MAQSQETFAQLFIGTLCAAGLLSNVRYSVTNFDTLPLPFHPQV
jgi:hypothetical protein